MYSHALCILVMSLSWLIAYCFLFFICLVQLIALIHVCVIRFETAACTNTSEMGLESYLGHRLISLFSRSNGGVLNQFCRLFTAQIRRKNNLQRIRDHSLNRCHAFQLLYWACIHALSGNDKPLLQCSCAFNTHIIYY